MSGDADQAPGLLPWGRSLLTAGTVALVIGLVLGNFPFLLVGILLAGAALSGRALPAPEVTVTRAAVAAQVRAGDAVDVTARAAWTPGAGAAVVHDRVPDPFDLVDGANLRAFDRTAGAGDIAYRAAAARRGTHRVGPAHVTFPDPLATAAARVVRVDTPGEVVVQASAGALDRVRTPPARGVLPQAGGDAAVRGLRTNDFRELRPYAPGDPLKSVNWKATARASRDEMNLVVNEYEVEGKKAVWLFVDASAATAAGTTAGSRFDALATATLSLASHFLGRGHRVGVTVYGSGTPRIVHPDVGRTQEHRLANILTFAEPAPVDAEPSGLAAGVEATRGFLARERPLTFVLTLLGRDETLAAGVTAARALASTGRRPGSVVVVTHEGAPDEGQGARVVALRERAQRDALARHGVHVIAWDPERTPLAAHLAAGVVPG